jgi:SAM-dependent methyltransferase
MAPFPSYPPDFVADLRALRRRPELAGSLWRSADLVALTYGRLWSLVAEVVPPAPTPAPARVLDVGCGTGVLSLELARAGHDVTAIDADRAAIALAERGAPHASPGRVTYHRADVHEWEGDEAAFDLVVTTRTLHHVDEPAVALERMRRWLRPGGRLVCVDFLHDRFDHRAARWLAQVRGLLEATRSFDPDGRLPPDPDEAVDRIEWEWEQEHVVEHPLNGTDDIEEPLGRLFRTERRSWHPYLYWDVLVGLDLDDAGAEKATARLVAAWEASLLAADELPSVLLRFVGTR